MLTLICSTAVLPCGAASSNLEESAYRLFARDVVKFEVYGEPNLSTELRISGNGTINVPLLGDVQVAGLSLAAAEQIIRETYIEKEIFVRPQITLQVREYSKKEISVLGQVGRQGKVELPVESPSLSIINAITLAGGFTRIGRSDAVKVTRKKPGSDAEQVFTLNVDEMISGRSKQPVFEVLPGDTVFVPERLF